MRLEKLLKKTTKSLHAERNTLRERLERIENLIGALGGSKPKVQRRAKHKAKISKARKAAWRAKKSKRGEVAAAA